MNIDYIKNYNRFISLIWFFFGIIMWLLYMPLLSIIEDGILTISILICAYPFTTYLSHTLLKRAIKKKRILLFIVQFFLITILMALLILLILQFFSVLEKFGILSPSKLFINKNPFFMNISIYFLQLYL